MRKKFLLMFLVLSLFSSMGGGHLFAQTTTISSVEDLVAFATSVNGGTSYEGQTVTLTSDLNLSGEWTPIGNGSRSSKTYTGNSFKGIFDGGDHAISGLTITSTSGANAAVGLFGIVDGGTVKNLKLTDVNINVPSSNLAGAAIGMMLNNAKADNITVSGAIFGNDGVGGIVGRMIINGTIANCINYASVTTSYGGIGGIVGKPYYDNGSDTSDFATITDCINNGTITASSYAGGIAGLARANVTDCVNNGEIKGGTQTGGIIGQLIAAGTVSGTNHVGGIIGSYTQTGDYSYYNVTIANNINRGEIAATQQCAAILGVNNIDGFTAMTATGNVSYYYVEGLEMFGNPEDMVIDATNEFIIEAADFATFKTAVEAGINVTLTADITTTAAITTSGVSSVVDLNGKTLTIGAGDNQFNDESNITIKNGDINITGVTVGGNAIFRLDEYEKTLVTTMTLENINLVGNGYSSAYGIFYIGSSSVLNVIGGEWDLKNDTFTDGGVFKADASAATLNIEGTKITAHNVRRFVTYAATEINNATIALSGDADEVDAEMEHGFNRSPLAISNSTITMTDMVGRGITAEKGAVTIENSSVTMTNVQEATIDVRGNQTVTIDSESTVTLDKEPTVTSGTITGNVTVDAGVGKVAKVGNTYYKTLQEAIDAIKNMDGEVNITLLDDATLDITAWQTLAIGGGNTTKITIDGDNGDNDFTLTFNKLNSDWNNVATNNNATLVLKNMTITDSGYNNGPWNRYDLNFACNTELVNVNATKALAFKAGATLNNVTINETGDNYAIWIQPNGQDIAIDNLVIESAGRGIKIDDQYVGNPALVVLEIKNAEFTTAKKSAILVKSPTGANITAENVNIENVAADKNNLVWVDSDGAANYGNVTVTGGTIAQEDAEEFKVAIKDNNDNVKGYYKSLQAAINAAVNGDVVTLLADNAENVTVTQKPDVKFTIDGADKTMTGTITIDGKSAAYATAGITVKNMNFTAATEAVCINLGVSGNNNTRYTSNVTVESCNFTGTDKTAAGIKSYTGGDKNLIVKDCTATGMHSLMQLKNTAGVSVTECEITESKNGISLGASSDVAINKTTVDCAGYGVRADANGDNGNATITDCTIEAFIPVVVRNASKDYALKFNGENNTMTATNEDGLWCAIGTSEYETNGQLPTAPTGDVTVTLNDTGLSMDGVYGEHFALNGEGTAESPYLINNLYELKGFRDQVNAGINYAGKYIQLNADINLEGENWVGIGTATADHGFMGNFDGKTYKIMNLTITNPALDSDGYAYAGFFGVTEGTDKDNQNTIKNLTIENVTINTTGHIAAAAIAYPYYTIVDNVKVCGNINITGGDYTAGALAYTRRCVDASNITVEGGENSIIKGEKTVGGVISDIQMNGGLTANYSNFSASNVTVEGEMSVGGISGIIAGQTLNTCSVMNVTLACNDARVGIVSGSLGAPSTISNATVEDVTGATNIIGATYDGGKAVEAKIGDTYYASLQAALNAVVEGTSNGTVELISDIDLTDVNWTPVGTETKPFIGSFNGNEHTIKNLNIVETEAAEGKAYVGLFGYAKNATIKNVVFENVNLNIACLDIDHSQGHIGAVAGSLEGTSTIENVTVKGDITVEATFDANGASRVAVVAGGNSYGNVTMKNVHVIANEGSYLKANNNVGALAGQLQGKSVFENCSSNIDVTGKKFFAGGIIGLAAGDQTFTNCHTTGDVKITAGREGRANDQYRVGGIAGGWADGKENVCTLIECSYTGQISGTNADGSVAAPLDYAGYVGRGYTLANCAGSKVVIDGVEYVQAYDTIYGIYEVNGNIEINTAVALKTVAETPSADSVSVVLGDDITLTETIKINAGQTRTATDNVVTIDLNGNTITGTDDNATGSFALIEIQPGAELIIEDSSEHSTGKITLTATNNREWNAYSSVISNQRGKLTIKAGTLEHLGGTDMAYGIDNLTNGKGTYAETVINGGTIKSTYRAIRQFLNGTEAENILTVNGGTIEGTNKSIWMQDPNKNANTGTLTVGENATLKGDVYLYVTEGSTEWPVAVSIADGALAEGSEVMTANVPAGYELQQDADGNYVVNQGVAKIGEVLYETLQEAINTVENNGTIVLIRDTDQNILAGNENLKPLNKVFTIDGDNHVVTGNWRFGRDDHNTDLSEITIKNVNFKGNGISILDFYKVTISECTFNDITTGNAIYVSADEYTSSIVVENCEMNNIEGAGINFRNPVNATVKGNKINGTGNNSITFQHGTAYTEAETGEYIIENNIFQNWANEASEGRALRIATGVKPRAITIENNVMIKDNAPEEFVKVTGNTDNVSVDENYWNGANPTSSNTPAYFLAEGVQVHNYYAAYDAETNTLSDLVTIEGAGETLEIFYTAAGEVTEQANAAYSLMFTVTDYASKEVSVKIGNKNPAENKGCDLLIPSSVKFNDQDFAVTSIPVDGFKECKGFDKLVVPGTITSVSNSAFYNCLRLTEVVIEEGVQKLGSSTFYKILDLQTLTLPSTLTRIASLCFNGTHNIKTIVCNAQTPPTAFTGCFTESVYKNALLYVDGKYEDYKAANGWSNFKNILAVGATQTIDKGRYTLIATITDVWNRTCSVKIGTAPTNTKPAELAIPEHVSFSGIEFDITSIPEGGFQNCNYFEGTLTIPAYITSIGKSAFQGCTRVTALVVEDGVTSLGTSDTFRQCLNIETITLPSTLTTIPTRCFHNIQQKLKVVECHALVPPTLASQFTEAAYKSATLYVHDVDAYKEANNWKRFNSIRLIGAVAQNKETEVEYKSIAEAVAAANAGETVQMLQNVNLENTITVAAGKEVVLDLNGKTVSYTTTEHKGEAMITNNGNLTITDSAEGGKLSYAYEGGADPSYSFGNSTIENKGVLTINAGTVENTSAAMSHASYAINTGAGATLNVEGGNILNLNGHAVRMVSFGTTLNTVNIEGGYIEGTRALQVQLPGSANSTTKPAMDLNITGGELKSNEENYNLAIYVYSNGQSAENVSVEISGGTFDGNVAVNAAATNSMLANAVVITDGTFNGYYGVFSYSEEDAAQAVISIVGGTFATNYSEWYAEDDYYVFKENIDGTYSVVEQTIFTQTTQLSAGWNWFSAYVDIEGVHDEDGQTVYEGLTMIQNALGTNGIQIKKQGNFSTYEKDLETWFGNFAIYNKETLFINVTESQELTIVGEIVNPEDHTITLNPNWNWIGYPLNTTLLMSEAFEQAGLTPSDGDIVKHQDDFASYLYIDEETKGWIGDFYMNPGEGFMYMNNSTSSNQLTYKYPTNSNNKSETRANVTTEVNHWTPNASQYPNNMTMMAMVDVEGGDYEVAAFVDGEVRGSARPIYVEALDNYMLFLTIHGEGVEEMTFKFYDLATGEESALNDRMNYSDNAIVGSLKEPYMFKRGTTGIGEASLSEINIYPNPTTTGKEINLQATCDKVEVFNALGVKVAEYQNVDSIDAIETAGIYVIRITNDSNVQNCRLVVK